MRMTVFGTGYLGATHAVCMAELGHEVLGIDIDDAKIAALTEGRAPFFEPALEELLRRHLDSGRLRFSTRPEDAVDFAQVHFIGVGTPQRHGSYAADTTALDAVIRSLCAALPASARDEGERHLVLGKSTVPVGTAERLQGIVGELPVTVAWNPEFLREGRAVEDTLRPDRIVLGVSEPGDAPGRYGPAEVEGIVREIYTEPLAGGSPLLTMNVETAELVKVSANAFLATKISFINAVSEVCEAAGADVTQLADAIGMDARIGRAFLNAGLGFGGGCLPKDIRAFMARAGELGADQALSFLREVDAINMRRRERTVQVARELCGGSLIGRRITVLGAAFKPHSDDVRDSPALNVAGALSLAGAAVTVYDPKAMDNARAVFPTLGYADSCAAALEGAELLILATEWPEFRELDPVETSAVVGEPGMLIDARNVLDLGAWEAAGWQVRALGR